MAQPSSSLEAWSGCSLSVSVSRGDLIHKPGGSKAKHQGYEVQLRLKDAPVFAIELPPSYKRQHVFDVYRSLSTDLRALGIDVVGADFPPTLKRSSLGIGLSENDLRHRVFMLNRWMSVVCSKCHGYPAAAQAKVLSVLGLDDYRVLNDFEKILHSLLTKNSVVIAGMSTRAFEQSHT